MSKKELIVKKDMEVSDVVSYINELANALKAGKLTVTKGDDSISLTPKGNINLRVTASRKKNDEFISFELGWSTVEKEEKKPSAFSISSKDAEPKKEKTEKIKKPENKPKAKPESVAPKTEPSLLK
ncbi:MAG: amphi-Trp domain-containing protein [Candidatus Auribacter fodinae]|jgi:amphi-Trp domain-containing protein|uniref:Amphi-Trp domain-containing protein n=1 Tax=Candidatus Auribacter fodinae TaxID=2093366 RepID=A0A3A4R1T2_9BACT|nr:MAG: amphi-Trp domain-containing protein [Candidatus Auribacter fodinae]